jgi:Tfp pilus assembly protein PilV
MVQRQGHSLIESLVAVIFLAVTFSGASATLLIAHRIDRAASVHLAVADLARRRVETFISGPCPARDSGWTETGGDGLPITWGITYTGATAILVGSPQGATERSIAVEVHRRCID